MHLATLDLVYTVLVMLLGSRVVQGTGNMRGLQTVSQHAVRLRGHSPHRCLPLGLLHSTTTTTDAVPDAGLCAAHAA